MQTNRISLLKSLVIGDKELAEHAITYLARQLEDKPNDMEAFVTAVQSEGRHSNACVPIPFNFDGRIHVSYFF